MSKNNNELKRMRLKVDEKGLGRVLSTLNISKILVPALAEFMMNIDRLAYIAMTPTVNNPLSREHSENVLFNRRGSYVAIPVRSASHYMDVLSDVLQGKPFAEEELDEVSILFMNRGVNVAVYDGGQQLQKGDVDILPGTFQGHSSWVYLEFNDDAYLKMAARFFTNQKDMSNDFMLSDNYSLDEMLSSLTPADLQPRFEFTLGTEYYSGYEPLDIDEDIDDLQEYSEDSLEWWLKDPKHYPYTSYRTGMTQEDVETYNDPGNLYGDDFQEDVPSAKWDEKLDSQDFREPEGVLLADSSSDTVTLSFKYGGGLRMAEIRMDYSNLGISFAPIYNGIVYSASGGNLFFYETKNIEKELGMVYFDTREGKDLYNAFLKAVADEFVKVESETDARLPNALLYKVVDEFEAKIRASFGDFSKRAHLLFLELKKVTDAKFPVMTTCFRLLNWWEGSKGDTQLQRCKVLHGIKGDEAIIIDARYYNVESRREDAGGKTRYFYNVSIGRKLVPPLPRVPKIERVDDDPNYRGRIYLLSLNRRLIEVLKRSQSVTIHTRVSSTGDIIYVGADPLDEESIGILVPDDMVTRGEGNSLSIKPNARVFERMFERNLLDNASASSKVMLVRDESSSSKIVKLSEIARSDVIIFRNGVPYRIPYNRMKEYGIKRVTERLDVAILYEDRALIDPFYSLWKKGVRFPKAGWSVLLSNVEAYDGLFLMWGKVKKDV